MSHWHPDLRVVGGDGKNSSNIKKKKVSERLIIRYLLLKKRAKKTPHKTCLTEL